MQISSQPHARVPKVQNLNSFKGGRWIFLKVQNLQSAKAKCLQFESNTPPLRTIYMFFFSFEDFLYSTSRSRDL